MSTPVEGLPPNARLVIAFWPPGPNPSYVYVANTDSVVRFPYRSGDLQPGAPPEKIVKGLPRGGHSTETRTARLEIAS